MKLVMAGGVVELCICVAYCAFVVRVQLGVSIVWTVAVAPQNSQTKAKRYQPYIKYISKKHMEPNQLIMQDTPRLY